MANKVKELHIKIQNLTRQFHDAILERFPIGATVHVEHRGHFKEAEVIMHGYGDRLKVHAVTGREYWVYVYRLKEFNER